MFLGDRLCVVLPCLTKSEELSLNSTSMGRRGEKLDYELDAVLYSLETIAFLSQQMVKRPPQLSPDFSISIFLRVDMGWK